MKFSLSETNITVYKQVTRCEFIIKSVYLCEYLNNMNYQIMDYLIYEKLDFY